jgi:hypothetical protein
MLLKNPTDFTQLKGLEIAANEGLNQTPDAKAESFRQYQEHEHNECKRGLFNSRPVKTD